MVPKDKYGGIDVLVNNAAIAFKNAAPEPMGVQVKHRPRARSLLSLRWPSMKFMFKFLGQFWYIVISIFQSK